MSGDYANAWLKAGEQVRILEARCARLQQALAALVAETEPEQHRGTEPHPEPGMCVWCDAREALAGPDTPAERVTHNRLEEV